jgi:hypothetical protein
MRSTRLEMAKLQGQVSAGQPEAQAGLAVTGARAELIFRPRLSRPLALSILRPDNLYWTHRNSIDNRKGV